MTPEQTMKPTNPKDLIGSNKPPLHLWPATASQLGCLALLDGALKYGRSNWRVAGVRVSIYYDALMRHMHAYFEGEDCDPESGLPHLSHALACLAILVDANVAGKLTDDRNVAGGYSKQRAGLAHTVDEIKKRHQNHPEPRHYTIDDSSGCPYVDCTLPFGHIHATDLKAASLLPCRDGRHGPWCDHPRVAQDG